MKSFQEFIVETPQLKKVKGPGGSHYHGTHDGVHFELWKSVHHTDTSRPSSRASQRAGYGSYASSRKDTVWNWREDGGSTKDGYGTKKQALNHITDLSKRKTGPWTPKS